MNFLNGADYAEFFEWKNNNNNEEDKTGYFVTLDNDKIKIANKDDYILGIVSNYPSFIGIYRKTNIFQNYQLDDFGNVKTEL